MLKRVILPLLLVMTLAGSLVVGGLIVGTAALFGGNFCSGSSDTTDSAEVVISGDEIRVSGKPLSAEQLNVAQQIIGIGRKRQLDDRDITTAIAVGYQESGLRNVRHGHLDSLGVFQQRPSQGWGTSQQILNVPYAINKFYDALVLVNDRSRMTILDVALKVQRPDPNAYRGIGRYSPTHRLTNWIPLGTELVKRATGAIVERVVPSSVQCTVSSWTGSAAPQAAMGFAPIGVCPSGRDVGVQRSASGQQVQLCDVHGIIVEASISSHVEALVAEARRAGINLSGSGFRSYQRQVELRKRHCGSSDYAIWRMPSRQCNPPTAIPGQSDHETGRAIDFRSQYGGMSYGDPAHTWMRQYATRAGFKEHPVEPWHWSLGTG